MKLLDNLLFGRIHIDKRCERPWWNVEGSYTVKAMVGLIPTVIACGFLMKIVGDMGLQFKKPHWVVALFRYIKRKFLQRTYRFRMSIIKAHDYLFGEVV